MVFQFDAGIGIFEKICDGSKVADFAGGGIDIGKNAMSDFIISQRGSTDQYSAYVDQCIAAGFNIDYSRDEKRFSAYDADGYHLVVEKRLFDKIYISIKIPER